uniref:Cell cycle regulator of NHEJ n=1 Tax=Cyanistes caeruleus TaxID=156563 RepID=A0A8C0U9Q2_CYACU
VFEILVLEFRSYITSSSYLMVDRGREAKTSLALYRALLSLELHARPACCFPSGRNPQCEESEDKARSRSEEEQELPPTANEAPGSTANTDGDGDHGPALPSPPGAGADAERTGGEDSEDDVLKYVREIFFS